MDYAASTAGAALVFVTSVTDSARTLVSTINGAMDAGAQPQDRLERNFDRWWPELEARLGALPPVPVPVQLTQTEMLVEILDAVRSTPPRTSSTKSRTSKDSARLPRSKQVNRVLEFLDSAGHLDTTRSADVRQQLANMPPPDLASVYHMVCDSTTKNGVLSDAAIFSIMTRIGRPWRSSALSFGSQTRDDA